MYWSIVSCGVVKKSVISVIGYFGQPQLIDWRRHAPRKRVGVGRARAESTGFRQGHGQGPRTTTRDAPASAPATRTNEELLLKREPKQACCIEHRPEKSHKTFLAVARTSKQPHHARYTHGMLKPNVLVRCNRSRQSRRRESRPRTGSLYPLCDGSSHVASQKMLAAQLVVCPS